MQTRDQVAVYTIKSVDKAIEILELLFGYSVGATLNQLASGAGLSSSGTFRIMKTLCSKGLVEMNSEGRYELGMQSVTFAHKMLRNSSAVMQYAHPILEDLARHHDEAAYLTVLKNDEVLFLDMVDCDQQIKTSPLVGKRFPFFSNAAGKVMKSMEPGDFMDKFFRKRGRPRLDAPDPAKLDEELKEIRKRGVAVDLGGLGEGIVSVAVAVRDYSGKVIGAITLIVPAFRMIGSRLENEIIPSLKEGADLLSGRFGYCPA